MDTNDFLGSFAQENVSFSTQIVRTASVGDNYWTAMVFCESDRFVDATADGWEEAPGLASCKVLVVTADTYAQYTSGLLQSWLYDLFCNGFTGNCILVAPASSSAPAVDSYQVVIPAGTENPSTEGWYEKNGDTYTLSADTTVDTAKTYYVKITTPGFVDAMNKAYEVLKPYAYHKTVCAGGTDSVSGEYALALTGLCETDTYLSGAPILPQTSDDLSQGLYAVLHAAGADAFMGWHSDSTRNAALYSLGLALAAYNGSGTPVGNGLDMTASSNITASNGGVNPTTGQKTRLKSAYVQYFKTIGDNTGNVAAETDKTINGKVYAAYWIVAYITYMVKVRVAQMLTQRNFYKNADNYAKILQVLQDRLTQFAQAGSLTQVRLSAPSFADLPEAADDELVIPNAWSATYVNHLRKVTITGNLYIGS